VRKSKQRLVAATLYLLVALIAISGATFAWFTLSTNPEIANIKATVTVNQNLEIALDNGYESANDVDKASTVTRVLGSYQEVQGSTAGNAYSWGNYIDLGKALAEDSIELKPVAYSEEDDTLYTAEYDLDGRISALYNLGDNKKTLNADLTNTVQVNDGCGAVLYGDSSNKYYGLKMVYWLRSNNDCSVTLTSEGAKRANSGEESTAEEGSVNGVTGKGSYILIEDANGNSEETIKAYLDNLVFRIKVEGEGQSESTLYIKPDTSNGFSAGQNVPLKLLESDEESAGEASIQLSKGVAAKVTCNMYLNGETLSNNDALLSKIEEMKINMQFTTSEPLTGAMEGPTTSSTVYTE